MLLNPESISILYEVALQDLALSPQDDKGMTDKILRDETSQPNTETWNTEIYLRSSVGMGIRDPLWIRAPGWEKIRIRIRDEQPGSYLRELRNNFLG